MGFNKTGADPIAKGYEVDDPREGEQFGKLDTEHDALDNEDCQEEGRREGSVRRFRRFAKRNKRRDRGGGS